MEMQSVIQRFKEIDFHKEGKQLVKDYLLLIAGTLMLALAFTSFFIPHDIAPGGVSGLSTVLSSVMPLSVGLLSFIINLPLFLLGMRTVGWRFALRSFISMTLLIRPWTIAGVTWGWQLILIMLAFGLIGTAIPYFLYVTGVQHLTEVSRAPVIASVETISAAVLGVLIFHEAMSFWKAAGICLVILSVAMMNRKSSSN